MAKFSRALLAGVASLFFANVVGAQQSESSRIAFVLEPQPLPDALNAWAQQAGLQIIWPADQAVSQSMAPRLNGTFTAESALQQLLLGSGLTYAFVDASTVALRFDRSSLVRQGSHSRRQPASVGVFPSRGRAMKLRKFSSPARTFVA